MCNNGKQPCKSNGPPYWVTAEFKRACDPLQPLDAIVIMLGTNDAKRTNWVDLGNQTQYRDDATRMVNVFRSLPQRPAVFIATPPPLYGDVYTMNQTVIGEVIPRILKAVAAETNATFIDVVTPLGGMDRALPWLFFPNETNGGCDVPKQCKGDGCHPDDAGHRAIANVVQHALGSAGVLPALDRADG